MSVRRPSARLLALLVGLTVAIVVLDRVGHGELATPPLTSATALRTWAGTTPAPVAAFALVRLLALGLAWYALGTTGFGIVARLTRQAALVHVADLLALPPTRRLLATTMGLGLSLSSLPIVAAPASAAPAAVHRTVERAPGGADPGRGRAPVVIERLPAAQPTRRSAPDPARPPVEQTWTVAGGQHCWGITADLLATRLGRPATDAEIDPAWRTFVEANRARFLDPANPDLILPGQVLVVPASLAPAPTPDPAPPASPASPAPSAEPRATAAPSGRPAAPPDPPVEDRAAPTTGAPTTSPATATTVEPPTSTSTTVPAPRATADLPPATLHPKEPEAPDLPPATLHREPPTTPPPTDTARLHREEP